MSFDRLPPDPRALQLLDAYLDNQLDAESRAQFEVLLEREPGIREMVDRQREIDVALTRTFAVPAGCDLFLQRLESTAEAHPTNGQSTNGHPTNGHPVSAPKVANWADGSQSNASIVVTSPEKKPLKIPTSSQRRRLLAIAALIALLLSPYAAWQVWESYREQPMVLSSQQKLDLDQIYNDLVASGFTPNAECHTVEDSFDSVLTARFKVPIAMKSLYPNMKIVGLSFPTTISPTTVMLMARVDDKPVIIFADSVEADHGQKLSAASKDLFLHKKLIGPVVLYEVSPFDKPTILNLLHRTSP